MNSRFALGIDIGTSGTRACVIDEKREVVVQSRAESPPFDRPRPGWSQQQPETWWQGVKDCLQQLGPKVRRSITNIAVDATSASICLSDDNGHALTPALMYNDSRARNASEKIKAAAPPTTAAHGAASSLAKALWLSEQFEQPNAWIVHQADWVTQRLSLQHGTTDYNNALKLGYDPINQCWPDWLSALTKLKLPTVVEPGHLLGTISARAAQELELSEQALIHAGTTDSTAAFIATGAFSPGDAVTSIGSTLVMKILTTEPVFAPEAGVYSHKFGDLWLAGGASNSGGRVLLNWFTPEELITLSSSINPDSTSGLDYYPLLEPGERFPINNPTLAPQLSPRPKDRQRFLQGLLEGIASVEKLAYERLQQLGSGYPRRVLTVGGGAKNEVWSKIRARMLDCEIHSPAQQEAAYGAALLALSGRLGEISGHKKDPA